MRFNLEINYLGDKYALKDLDSGDYDYLCLLNDVCGTATGCKTRWLSEVVAVEGVMPDTGDTFLINTDEDIETLIATYLCIRIEDVCVKLNISAPLSVEGLTSSSQITQVHEPEDLIPARIVLSNESNEEGSIEIEEIFEWSDSENDGLGMDDDLSDYNSDRDQEIFYSDDENLEDDDDLPVRVPVEVLSDAMEGEYFEFSTDKNGNKIVELKAGQIFDGVEHLKEILRKYTIQEGIKLKKLKNDKVRLTAKCNTDKNCPWRLHASTYGDGVTFKIKSLKGVHTCVRNLKGSGATAKWIANEFKEEFKSNSNKSVEELDNALRTKFGIHASASKLFRARKLAMEEALGDHEASYANIPRYIVALKESCPGAFVKLKCDGLDISNPHCTPKFERIFIYFEAQYEGYIRGCRPFIGVDGCFLKGPYKGDFFTAVALDANSGIFPIAVMICEGENEDSWSYFFDCLKTYMQEERVIIFMSDRQKGLKKAVKSNFSFLSQRYCARHLYANFRAKFPGPKMRKLFWIGVNAYTEEDFKSAMESIKQADAAAYKWLMETCNEHPSTWSKHGFDTVTKVDHVTNNMTESFNAWMGKMRQRPVISMLEWYRTKVMKRFFTRYQKALGWKTKLPPNVNTKVEENQRHGRKLLAVPSSEFLFEVNDDKKYVVNLREKTCQCNEWQVCGVPCKHAMSCILYMRYDPVEYVSPYLTREAYLRTYNGMINVVPDESKWPRNTQIPPLKPPPHKRKNIVFKQGSLQTNRRREPNEAPKVHKRSIHVTCKICNEVGHNKRTCIKRGACDKVIQGSSQSTREQNVGS